MKTNKIYFGLFFFILAAMFLTSCEEEDKSYSDEDRLHFERDTTEVLEGDTSNWVSMKIIFLKKSAISATTTVTISGGTEGVDYVLQDPNLTFTFGPDDFEKEFFIKPVDNSVLNADKIITLSLTSSDIGVGFPGPDNLNSTHGLVIVDDDCPKPLEGTYDIISSSGCQGDNAGGCGATTYDPFPWEATTTPNIVLTECFEDGKYVIDDITFGFYIGAYGASAGNPGTIVVTGNVISIITAESPDVVFPSYMDSFSGDGTINADGTITINFTNTYGDQGTVVLQAQ